MRRAGTSARELYRRALDAYFPAAELAVTAIALRLAATRVHRERRWGAEIVTWGGTATAKWTGCAPWGPLIHGPRDPEVLRAVDGTPRPDKRLGEKKAEEGRVAGGAEGEPGGDAEGQASR